jgi:hypothetical protein
LTVASKRSIAAIAAFSLGDHLGRRSGGISAKGGKPPRLSARLRQDQQRRALLPFDCLLARRIRRGSLKLRALIDEKDKLNAKSPPIPKRAYQKGKHGIELGPWSCIST